MTARVSSVLALIRTTSIFSASCGLLPRLARGLKRTLRVNERERRCGPQEKKDRFKVWGHRVTRCFASVTSFISFISSKRRFTMEKHAVLIAIVLALTLALPSVSAFATEDQKLVNVNDADAGQLALLPRVGPALAARIIEFREENGKFEASEDLMLVRGIGEKTFDLMQPFVAVSGKTTLSKKVKVSDLLAQREETKEDR